MSRCLDGDRIDKDGPQRGVHPRRPQSHCKLGEVLEQRGNKDYLLARIDKALKTISEEDPSAVKSDNA